MQPNDSPVQVYEVRQNNDRTRGRWLFAVRENAFRHVEHDTSDTVHWRRQGGYRWIAETDTGTWTVAPVDVQDAVAIAADEPVAARP